MSESALPRRSLSLRAWRALERGFDAAFGSRLDPLRHLGSLGFLALWLLAGTGAVLFIVLDTSVEGAWRSIHALADLPLATGTLLRGTHRYAADVLVVLMGLHLVREWLAGHAHGVRRFPWLTGVPLVGFVFMCAIGGFWLNWDALGQYSAIATAEWLDALPLFAAPLARNFLGAEAVNDRLFSLFVFVHIGVPLLLLFGLWFHVQRLTRAAVWPPRALAAGTIALLLALALAAPVTSHAPAALARAPGTVRLDWIVLFVHPLVEATSPAAVWALVAAGAIVLLTLPFWPRRGAAGRAAPVAVVAPAHCNGCQRCFADCPYAAITMAPHPNQRVGRTLAVVDDDLCAACGICAGSCPSSTPFRSAAELVSGIDMPALGIGELRRRLREGLEAAHAAQTAHMARPLVLFGCDHGVRTRDGAAQAPDVVAIDLLCSGQLPPSFIEYALRDGAAGVLVAACREGGCEFRFGERLALERLEGRREPHLRAGASRERVAFVFAGSGDGTGVAAALDTLRRRVQALPPPAPEDRPPFEGRDAAALAGF